MRLHLLSMWGKQMTIEVVLSSPHFPDPAVSLCDGRCYVHKWGVITRSRVCCFCAVFFFSDNNNQVKSSR